VRLLGAYLDHAPLTRLRQALRIVTDAVLPSQLLRDIRKRVRHVLQRVCGVFSSASAVREFLEITAANLVIASAGPTRTATAASAHPAATTVAAAEDAAEDLSKHVNGRLRDLDH